MNFQNLNLKSVSKNSDSFDDRFCDDLCEVILQYLPLKDKLSLECVSKQFRRTVFLKQNEIILQLEIKGNKCPPLNESNLLRVKYPADYLEDKEMEVESFQSFYQKPIESLLKKCPNIQSIDLIEFHSNNNQISKLMLQIITKYCNHLIEFKGMSNYINNSNESQEFCRNFGPKLKQFRYANNVFDFNLFPNIETIDGFSVLDPIRVEKMLQLNPLNHLKKLEVCINVNKELLLRKVMKKFKKLTHLSIKLRTKESNKVFKDFPFSQNLIDLALRFPYNHVFEGMCYSLKQIANKCPKLKRIVFHSQFILKDISEVKQLFQLLEAFPSLKRLDINFKDRTCFQTTNQWFSFELFKGFPQQLTHLDLRFCGHQTNASIHKDIDIYLPKLQYLSFHSPVKIDQKGMTQMATILSRLSRLQTIRVKFDREVDYQPMKAMIIEKCPKIKTIKFF